MSSTVEMSNPNIFQYYDIVTIVHLHNKHPSIDDNILQFIPKCKRNIGCILYIIIILHYDRSLLARVLQYYCTFPFYSRSYFLSRQIFIVSMTLPVDESREYYVEIEK